MSANNLAVTDAVAMMKDLDFQLFVSQNKPIVPSMLVSSARSRIYISDSYVKDLGSYVFQLENMKLQIMQTDTDDLFKVYTLVIID